MAATSNTLEHILAELATTVPAEVLERLCRDLSSAGTSAPNVLRLRVLAGVTHAKARERVGALFDCWASRPDISPAALALALRSAAGAATQAAKPQVELVWTGPNTPEAQLRRTDQALLELIHSAQRDLIIVSFAVYDVRDILQAIAASQRRGVRVMMCIESADRSAGRTARQTLASSGLGIEHGIEIYHWPAEQRHVDSGRPGVLHAKFAVADDHTLFISSANLTGDALALNIELGVLIRGGTQAGEVKRHVERLVEGGVLRRV